MYKIKKGFEGNRVGFRLVDGSAFNKMLSEATQEELKQLYNAGLNGIIKSKKTKDNEKKADPPKLENFDGKK